MNQRGVVDSGRSEAVYDAFAWGESDRPEWWVSDTLMWEFTDALGRKFSTSNLDDAVSKLVESVGGTADEWRRALFMNAPLNVSEQANLGVENVTASAYGRHLYLRQQVRRLLELEASLSRFRESLIEDVLSTITRAYKAQSLTLDCLLDDSDSLYLGVKEKTLKEWANEFDAYEVQTYLQAYRTRMQAADRKKVLRASRNDADPRREHELLLKKHAYDLNRFTLYFDAEDFVPQNEHERRALELHRVMRGADSAEAEEKAAVMRDLYLIENVF